MRRFDEATPVAFASQCYFSTQTYTYQNSPVVLLPLLILLLLLPLVLKLLQPLFPPSGALLVLLAEILSQSQLHCTFSICCVLTLSFATCAVSFVRCFSSSFSSWLLILLRALQLLLFSPSSYSSLFGPGLSHLNWLLVFAYVLAGSMCSFSYSPSVWSSRMNARSEPMNASHCAEAKSWNESPLSLAFRQIDKRSVRSRFAHFAPNARVWIGAD